MECSNFAHQNHFNYLHIIFLSKIKIITILICTYKCMFIIYFLFFSRQLVLVSSMCPVGRVKCFTNRETEGASKYITANEFGVCMG